jgi:hypothetical protein
MGWSIRIETDREVARDDARRIVSGLPRWLLDGVLPASEQSWGWSAAVDVNHPEGFFWRISGSYSLSGKLAESAALRIVQGLLAAGYRVVSIDTSGFDL